MVLYTKKIFDFSVILSLSIIVPPSHCSVLCPQGKAFNLPIFSACVCARARTGDAFIFHCKLCVLFSAVFLQYGTRTHHASIVFARFQTCSSISDPPKSYPWDFDMAKNSSTANRHRNLPCLVCVSKHCVQKRVLRQT